MAANGQAPRIERRLVGECQDDNVLPTDHSHNVLFVVPLEWHINSTEVFQSVDS